MKFHGDKRFYRTLVEIAKLHSQKNHDYAGNDPLSNFKLSEKMDILAWKGCLIRMTDKISRLWNFAKQDNLEVKDETIIDTLKDLAVYSIICVLLYEDKEEK